MPVKTALLAGSAALVLTLASPALADPSVCWAYPGESNTIPDRRVGEFCHHLRHGLDRLQKGYRQGAETAFAVAAAAAESLSTAEQRALAADEARAAQALAAEADGRVAEALALIRQPSRSPRDGVALARAYMLARQEEFDLALTAFAEAHRAMPNFWCPDEDSAVAAIRQLRDGTPTAWPTNANEHYLPSYLVQSYTTGECPANKAFLAKVPTSRAYHAAFGLGSVSPQQADAVLATMTRHITSSNLSSDKGWRWVLVGHADQACPSDSSINCGQSNMRLSRDRAEMVRKLLRPLVPNVELDVEYRGMEAPIVDAPGKAEKRNRRVELVPRNRGADGKASRQCPWEVEIHRPDLAGSMGGGGTVSTPVVRAGAQSTSFIGRQGVYTIRYVAEAAPAEAKYVYAFAENQDTTQSDLLAVAGLSDNTATALRDGGRLAGNQAFQPDHGTSRETIRLYVADQRVEQLETLRRSPVVAHANGGRVVTNARFTSWQDNTQTSLADLGNSKGYDPFAGTRRQASQLRVSGPGAATAPPPPAVIPTAETKLAPPPKAEPKVASCSFHLNVTP